jgi:RNA polymerase sigma-70 factor (ECF subfamily)
MTDAADDIGAWKGFQATIQHEAPRLWRLALVILRDPGEAEDAVQETAIKAWRHWDPERDNSRAWLTRICVNQCLDRRGPLLRIRAVSHLPAQVASRDAVLHDPDLARAFGLLTARQRAVIALHYQYGYSIDDSARLMGCRPGTARSHLARALASLRSELDDA